MLNECEFSVGAPTKARDERKRQSVWRAADEIKFSGVAVARVLCALRR
jgi:hypothetical protein